MRREETPMAEWRWERKPLGLQAEIMLFDLLQSFPEVNRDNATMTDQIT